MITGDLQPGASVGEYRIDRTIGEGSFGKVYAATHPMIGKRAAIKVLGFEHSQSPQFVSRFLEEARAVNKIRHRNIVDIFSFGKLDDGRHYLVMELLEGKPMGDWLAERGAIPIAEALPVLRKVARALEAAHKHGIAHRDLKPDNIFLTFDEDGIVFPVLLDFGIAKLMGDSPMGHKTQTGTPMGTPLYMSPEQCRGSHMDHHTDIYSFGVVVFEMLTGRRPFDSDNVMAILMSHLTATPPTMSSVNPAVPAALDPPIQRMLEKSPEARPPSITIAIEALIAAAKSIGISVPSSRNAAISGLDFSGSTAPMGFDGGGRVQTVPEAPMDANASLPPATPRQIPHYEITKESVAYQAPPAVPAHTHATSSLKPVGAAVPPPPSRQKKRGGGALLFVFGGIVALLLVVGGGAYALWPGPSPDDTEDDDEPSDDDSGGGKSKRKSAKPSPVTPAPDKKDGVRFTDVVMRNGSVLESSESTVFTFTRVVGSTKQNIATTNTRVSRFEVVGADGAAVQRGNISFSKAEQSTSVDRGAPQTENNPIRGQSYETERQGGSVVVKKLGATLSNEERTDVERHVAALLGPSILGSTLGGKTVSIGDQLDLSLLAVLSLLRETERMKFPKLNGSITLQKVTVEGGSRVAVFNTAISFHYKQDDGSIFKSDMTGTIHVRVDTTWVTALEMYGPLDIESADTSVKFEPGTFNYSYTNTYP